MLTDQVEEIEILFYLLAQIFQNDAVGFQLLDQHAFLIRRLPAGEKIIQAAKRTLEPFARVIAQAFGD